LPKAKFYKKINIQGFARVFTFDGVQSKYGLRFMHGGRMQDAQLMLRVREGDEAAFREIVEGYKQQILDLCFRYIGNQADAEEVALDVFFHLYKARETYKPEAKLSTFLYRIAVNLSLNRIRDRKRKRLLSLDFLGRDRPIDPESPETERPDAILETREREAMIRKAIDLLPEKQKTALLLRRYEEMSYEEIAAVMKTSVSAVEALLFRARETLKKKLKPLLG
jgi:RNA polymerase sigma-70 factor (ECF subfamily)